MFHVKHSDRRRFGSVPLKEQNPRLPSWKWNYLLEQKTLRKRTSFQLEVSHGSEEYAETSRFQERKSSLDQFPYIHPSTSE